MAFCIQCGATIKDGAKFCPKCGAKQDEAPAAVETADEEESEELYDVYVESVDDARKMEVLQEIRAIAGLDLAEAGEIVENSGYVKEGISKEEAEQLKQKLESLGATVSVDVSDDDDEDLYDVFLVEVDAARKMEVLNKIRELTGIGLAEAKNLVDTSCSLVAEAVTQEEASEMKEALEAAGATVSIEESEEEDDDEDEEDGEGEDDDVPDEGGEEVPDGVFRQPNTQPRAVEEKTSLKDTCLGCGCLTVIAIVVINVVIKFVL